MKKLYLCILAFSVCAITSFGQSIVHYWNFNNTSSISSLLTPTSTVVATPSITHEAGGISAIQITSNTGQGFDVTNPNAQNGDAAGTHLRFNDPIGGGLLFALPTTGYKDVIIKYATRRSGSGAGNQIIEYSTDGTTFQAFSTINPVDGNPTLVTLDFSSITLADDNANFKIRITFQQGSGGLVGNNRFDNFILEGISLAGDTAPPTVNFDPVNASVNIFITSDITLTFNEDIRLIDNSAINNTNVDNLVELRLTNVVGTPVLFDATITGKVITINPTSDLLSNQVYYVALKSNSIEDLAGNAITATQSASFTTLVPQTQFAAGDLAFVAYRMNATGTDDEIAFITLVNILAGTMINFTDAKYTDNAQPQCAGGFTWIAPSSGVGAGTVISIKTDAIVPSIGTTSGSGFGLSSGGDQIIVYTGTATSPLFITALSSNAWLSSNTNCAGSNSKLPALLTEGQSAINLSTAPGNTSGNTVNAYYNGTRSGTVAELKTAILNPANWVGVTSNTPAQIWPVWNFPGPPSVTNVSVESQTTLKVTFSSGLSAGTATQAANYTGIAGLATALLSVDGKEVTLSYSTPFAIGSTYTLTISGVTDTDGRVMLNYQFSFTYSTTISFDKKFTSVKEEDGTIVVNLKVVNPSSSSVKVIAKAAPFSNTTSDDYTFTEQTLTLTGSSSLTQSITLSINNDTQAEQDEYLVLSLENASGLSVTGGSYMTIFIQDNDRVVPQGTKSIELSHVSSYSPPVDGTAEIVVHDPASQRLFIISSIENRLDIANFSNPAAVTHVASIDMTPYGGITSVATKNGIVAVASPNADQQQNGSVVFFNTNGVFQKQVTVGALPDMITFTPDGSKVLTANEGQPNDAYTIDPEGSVSIVDISGGISGLSQFNVSTILFTNFNAQESALLTAGVRKLKSSSTFSQDFEPEFITISEDSKKAWVTLQENNAIAELDIETKAFTTVWPMGKKDFNTFGNGFDASDNSGIVTISNWPVKAFYIPDAVANYVVGGKRYLVTANEGDEKEYGGLNERTTVGAVTLDPTIFPHASVLKENHNLGRLRITSLSGDVDNDGDFDELNMVGGRSFTVWDAATKAKVFDSGDDFERIIAAHPVYSPLFNADNENNTLKGRSRAKGPEPEGLALAAFNNKTYAFVALERVGGIMVYDITDPSAAKFVDYKNSRSTTAYAGDHGPEGVTFITRENSPNGKRYVVVANEISGSVSIFEVVGKDEQTITFNVQDKTFGDSPFALPATASSGLAISFSTTDDEITLSGAQATLVKAGRVTITAAQSGNEFFNAASPVERSFCINPSKPVITQQDQYTSNWKLTSSASTGNQWYKDNSPITGATNSTFSISEEGVYTVKVTAETCESQFSEAFPIIIAGLSGNSERNLLKITPNPVSDQIEIDLPDEGLKEIYIYNSSGITQGIFQTHEHQAFIDVGKFNAGYFMLLVKTKKGVYVGKFVKL